MVKPVPPLSVRDSWPAPNFVNPETRSHALFYGVTILLTAMMLIVMSLRAYTRFIVLQTIGWDDFFIIIAAIFSVGLCVSVDLSINYGWDRHIWDQKPQWFQVSELFNYVGQIQYITLITCAKLSALCTYLRISQNTKYRKFIWLTVVVVALWGISLLFTTVFECWPVYLYWTSVDGKGCSEEDTRLMVGTIINIFTDVQVILMPIPLILALELPVWDKLVLGFLMCMGIFATIASVVRTVVMAEALTVYRYDVTWMGYEVWIWLIVECNLAIICISIPVMRALVRKHAPCLSMTGRGSKGFTSFASGSIFRRTSVRVESEDARIAYSEDEKARQILYMDEEHGLESRWTERFQHTERDQLSYQGPQLAHQKSRMDDAYYQHHDHFIGIAT